MNFLPLTIFTSSILEKLLTNMFTQTNVAASEVDHGHYLNGDHGDNDRDHDDDRGDHDHHLDGDHGDEGPCQDPAL